MCFTDDMNMLSVLTEDNTDGRAAVHLLTVSIVTQALLKTDF